MKRIFTLLSSVLLTVSVFMHWQLNAQAPEKMSYQVVVRNNAGQLVTNTQIGIQISIFQGTSEGVIVYSEVQTPTTNTNGLVSIEIGWETGFDTIKWSSGPYFIKTKIAVEAPLTTYTIEGASQILSVPYALHAKTADRSNETLNLADVLEQSNDGSAMQIKNISDPTDPQDAATKTYVDKLESKVNELEMILIEARIIDTLKFKDTRDGNVYKTIKIGDQVWMAENLKYLPSVSVPSTVSQTTPCYYVYGYYGTSVPAAKATFNYATYGVLYNWSATMAGSASSTTNPSNVQGVCPTGWHLPSDAEWEQLTTYLGGEHVAGSKLKEAGTTHWESPNTRATNETGFSALPGGYTAGGAFIGIRDHGFWWSATENDATAASSQHMCYDSHYLNIVIFSKEYPSSVRCLRDN